MKLMNITNPLTRDPGLIVPRNALPAEVRPNWIRIISEFDYFLPSLVLTALPGEMIQSEALSLIWISYG